MLRLVSILCAWSLLASPVVAQDSIRLRMTPGMLETGFDKHILPRFKFKHRIALTAVGPDDEAEIAFLVDDESPGRVFSTMDGQAVRLVALVEESTAMESEATFREWLSSTPGRAAIETFAPNGKVLFSTEAPVAELVIAKTMDGDTELGSQLAILHCGRCHVVDERNRMGGIGSTPSFAALRGREDWDNLFMAYWTQNPHPSFTQIAGLTEPFSPDRPTHVQPVELTLDDVEAITSFVGTIKALDLGAPIQSQ